MAVKPAQRCYEMLRPLTWATVLATLSAMFGGLSYVTAFLANHPASPEVAQKAWAGVAEALVPGILAFGLLAVAWALATIGLKRLT